jgi:hypothetical protein
MMNPNIRLMLDKMGIIGMHDSLSELKVRSKYFLGYTEVLSHAQKDFRQKLPKIFPPSEDPSVKNEAAIKGMTIMNPKFAMVDMEDERFQNQQWDDDCFGTMFFCNATESDDDEDEFPSAWMVKYEIFYEDDVIQLVSKNGEHAFDPAALAYQSFSSALH